MKSSKTQLLPLALAGLILLESCASSTVIQSTPTGAKLYLNNELVGTTPHNYTDTKIVGSTTDVRLEKEGYEPLFTSFSRSERADAGAIVGGLFLLFPFLWTMKYNPSRTYELRPTTGNEPSGITPMPLANDQSVMSSSKATRLREAKKLLDDGILTKDEYEKEKKKILDADN